VSPSDTATGVTLADLKPDTIIDITFQNGDFVLKWQIRIVTAPSVDADGVTWADILRGRPYFNSDTGWKEEPGHRKISWGRMTHHSKCEFDAEKKNLAQYGLVARPDGTWAEGFELRVVKPVSA
jgi:hypothetical protein